MSFKDEVNQRKAFAEMNNTLINQVKDEILKGAARGLSSIFIPLQSKNGEDTQKIIQFLKEEGFFFGLIDYALSYFLNVKNTLEMLTKILDNADFENEVYLYHSSW